jgi:hypothetical protein
MQRREHNVFGLAIIALTLAHGLAFAKAADGVFRGMIVCEKLKTSQFILRGPLDIIVTDKTAIAARPIFNIKGTLVVGSEIATGKVEDDGTIKLNSKWKGGGSVFEGNYSGVLNDKGGTLTGTQAWTWSTPEGQQTRNCTASVVKTQSN